MNDPLITDDASRWQRVLARDRACDGMFVTAVATTGIYCRPSCPARTPKRENVSFFARPEDAEAAGYRACLRCRPDSLARDEAAVRDAIAAIRDAAGGLEEGAVTLNRLGALTGYAPTHLQKLFKRHTGLSPAAFARALKRERAADALSDGGRVTEAVYAAGYGAPSRFYADAGARMGMAPSAWARGGRGVTIHWAVVPTSLGAMLVASTEKGVCRLSFFEDERQLAARFPEAELVRGGVAFDALLRDVVAAVETPGAAAAAHIPLDVRGTAFQEAVWEQLRRIPPGETRSYAEIAACIGRPGAVRATGSANGANNVAVLIPCHRVIRSDGSMGGYAYGLGIKEELLRRERGG